MVVFPVQGVPVMRMTCFMSVFWVFGLVIGCACDLVCFGVGGAGV